MEILSFEGGSSSSPRKKKSLKVVLGLSVIAGVAVFGSTLAASVTINSGSAFQFGQGIVQATACDSAITVSATSSFVNATTAGSFKLNSIALSGIADACDGNVFKVSVWGDTSNTALESVSGSSSITFTYDKDSGTAAAFADVTVPTSGTGVTDSGTRASADAGAVTLTISTPNVAAGDVYKISIEEQ